MRVIWGGCPTPATFGPRSTPSRPYENSMTPIAPGRNVVPQQPPRPAKVSSRAPTLCSLQNREVARDPAPDGSEAASSASSTRGPTPPPAADLNAPSASPFRVNQIKRPTGTMAQIRNAPLAQVRAQYSCLSCERICANGKKAPKRGGTDLHPKRNSLARERRESICACGTRAGGRPPTPPREAPCGGSPCARKRR
jgi:hypothetical protein